MNSNLALKKVAPWTDEDFAISCRTNDYHGEPSDRTRVLFAMVQAERDRDTFSMWCHTNAMSSVTPAERVRRDSAYLSDPRWDH
jgi:hypothetical protein